MYSGLMFKRFRQEDKTWGIAWGLGKGFTKAKRTASVRDVSGVSGSSSAAGKADNAAKFDALPERPTFDDILGGPVPAPQQAPQQIAGNAQQQLAAAVPGRQQAPVVQQVLPPPAPARQTAVSSDLSSSSHSSMGSDSNFIENYTRGLLGKKYMKY
jgi:hypothetical protein